ncbi:MAG TPA: hypothetical protein VHB68_03500, partial [Steroidobacteraceae bacterium]|nr:hypothetical protein [Steroidobacteraceae bacterium]
MTDTSLSRRALAAALSLLPLTGAAAASAASRRSRTAQLSPADRQAIEDLYVRYAWSYDCNDEQSF